MSSMFRSLGSGPNQLDFLHDCCGLSPLFSVRSARTRATDKATHLGVVGDGRLAVTRFPFLAATGPAAQYSIAAE
ncbi:hypothetical protein SAMN06266787_101433 [Halorubrum ezzemoulense]|uniref:Uncharacterized protein n=1 Tax=Halorubrum ezzemoulense TaxID=337243 RepID=A0A238UUD5_HALEZ|nr:hypothetical protein SAMN06266787_101433 [Halorubrum ezzemoulense]